MVPQPEALNKYYFDLFVKTFKTKSPEYEKCQRGLITPLGRVEAISTFDPSVGFVGRPAIVGQHSDYMLFPRKSIRRKRSLSQDLHSVAKRSGLELTCTTVGNAESENYYQNFCVIILARAVLKAILPMRTGKQLN